MANYTTVDGYKFDAQVNYGWGLTLNMTGKAPEVSKRIFDTYEHMLYYVNDYNDSCVEGLTLKVMADGEKNGVYFVAKIGTEGADKAFANDGEVIKLASEGKVNNNVTVLQEALDDEIAARKAVDGQTGQTYVANSDATHISAATSLNDADIKLNDAITSETKNRQDYVDSLNVGYTQAISVDANGKATSNHIGFTLSQTDGKISEFTITEHDIASNYDLSQEIAARKAVDGQSGQTYVAEPFSNYIKDATSLTDADLKLDAALKLHVTVPSDYSVVYPTTDETGGIEFLNTIANDTVLESLEKVDSNVALLVEETLKNENVVAAAITEIKESVGLDENLKYVQNTSANYIQNATTFSDADSLLDSAIKAEVIARENAISNLSSASTEGLNDEIETRQRIEGQSGTAYTKNTTSSYISGATSMNDADVKLDSAIKNLKLTAVTGTELTGLGENVKEAYKFIDELGAIHGDYIKIYKDSSLEDVEFIGSAQTLNFTYILANGSTITVPVELSAFLSEEEYADGLQVNNHVISVKIDEDSESFLTVSKNGVKLSGVQNAIDSAVNNLDSTITSDDTALVSVQVKQENGKITDVVVTGNDIDCGTF